jgi:hypothetical protein
VSAGETESDELCFQVLENQSRAAGVHSMWGGKVDEGVHKSCLETITPSDQRLSSLWHLSRISAVRWRESQRFCKLVHADCRNANPRYGARSI